MKKINVILILLLMFLLTGCGNKFDLYQGTQDIKITRGSDSGTARIKIKDTYKKEGENYIIFTTDQTEEQEFVLSKKKYDEYIGNGNDAVDYTSYNLQLDTVLYKYKDNILFVYSSNNDNTIKLNNIIKKYQDIEVYQENKDHVGSSSICIKKYLDNKFDKPDYTILSENDKDKNDDTRAFTGRTVEILNVSRYSFMGETDFTEDDVNHYCKIIDEISNKILLGISTEK